jgi:hypothetical protein
VNQDGTITLENPNSCQIDYINKGLDRKIPTKVTVYPKPISTRLYVYIVFEGLPLGEEFKYSCDGILNNRIKFPESQEETNLLVVSDLSLNKYGQIGLGGATIEAIVELINYSGKNKYDGILNGGDGAYNYHNFQVNESKTKEDGGEEGNKYMSKLTSITSILFYWVKIF